MIKIVICPSCTKAELQELVPGVTTCPSCRKIFRGEIKEEKVEKKETEILDGEFFMKNTALNPQWEIADLGMTVARERNKWWIAVLLCHSPSFPNIKYVRISWWKKSVNIHGGMFKIDDFDELENVIIALTRINNDFNEEFNPKDDKSISYSPIEERINIASKDFIFDEKKRICPKCKYKMKKSRNKRYYECEMCGEIIVLDEGHPIYDFPFEALPLNYSTNFPVNFYLPSYGITVRLTMADWKAVTLIYSKENPEKKWLRFYWWQRNLQRYMSSEYSLGNTQGLRWETKKGVMSPNVYEKEQIPKLIDALQKIKMEWVKLKNERTKIKKKRTISNNLSKTSEINQISEKKKVDAINIPDIRSKKAEIVHWILDNCKPDQYTKTELVRKKKTDLILEVRKVNSEK